jgi:hypothetical protein
LICVSSPSWEREKTIFELYSSLYLNTASHLIGTPRWLLPFHTHNSQFFVSIYRMICFLSRVNANVCMSRHFTLIILFDWNVFSTVFNQLIRFVIFTHKFFFHTHTQHSQRCHQVPFTCTSFCTRAFCSWNTNKSTWNCLALHMPIFLYLVYLRNNCRKWNKNRGDEHFAVFFLFYRSTTFSSSKRRAI